MKIETYFLLYYLLTLGAYGIPVVVNWDKLKEEFPLLGKHPVGFIVAIFLVAPFAPIIGIIKALSGKPD